MGSQGGLEDALELRIAIMAEGATEKPSCLPWSLSSDRASTAGCQGLMRYHIMGGCQRIGSNAKC